MVVELRELEEAATLDGLEEGLSVDERVRVVGFARPLRTRRPRAAQPEIGLLFEQFPDDGAFADPAGAEDDEDQR